jgi:hypothetical protein
MGMMPGLLQMARQEPYQSAQMIGERSSDIMDWLLQYLAVSKGQPFMGQTGGSPGLLDIAGAVAPFL